jgi:GntR family transcriptional regulator, sialic acid-inducible nan operon repressor
VTTRGNAGAKRRTRQAGYESIVELIRAGDGEAAEHAWRGHMKSARRWVAKTHKQDRVDDLLY